MIVFQEYKNNSTTPIEAKYVFPVDDMAAGVCPVELTFFSFCHLLISAEAPYGVGGGGRRVVGEEAQETKGTSPPPPLVFPVPFFVPSS